MYFYRLYAVLALLLLATPAFAGVSSSLDDPQKSAEISAFLESTHRQGLGFVVLKDGSVYRATRPKYHSSTVLKLTGCGMTRLNITSKNIDVIIGAKSYTRDDVGYASIAAKYDMLCLREQTKLAAKRKAFSKQRDAALAKKPEPKKTLGLKKSTWEKIGGAAIVTFLAIVLSL